MRGIIGDLERGRTGTALTRLLELWPKHRCAELAELIDRLSSRMNEAVPPLPTGQAAWMERYQARQPADLDALLRDLDDPTSKELKIRVDAIRELPPDPRTTAPLLAWAERTIERSGVWAKVYTALYKVALRTGDPRMQQGLEQHRKHRATIPRFGVVDPELARLDKLLAKFPEPDPAPEGLEAVQAAIEALSGPGEVYLSKADPTAEIRQSIFEQPDDDGAIEVWADLLQQAGDPLGLWVTLQLKQAREGLTRKEAAQERRLRKAHLVRILDDLAPMVDPKTARFRRGLLVRARLKEPSDHPALAALEQVHTTATDLRSGRFPRVTRFGMFLAPCNQDKWDAPRGFERLKVTPPGWGHLQQLCRGAPLPLRAVSVSLPRSTPGAKQLRGLDGPGLPDFQELHLYRNARYDDALENTLGDLIDHPILRVPRLVLHKPPWTGSSIAYFDRVRGPGKRLTVLREDTVVEIWEDGGSMHAELTGRSGDLYPALLEDELGEIERFDAVTVRTAAGKLESRAAFEKLLRDVAKVELPS